MANKTLQRTPATKRPAPLIFVVAVPNAVVVSGLLGLTWNVIAVVLMGGSIADALTTPSWMLAGAVAGATAGVFTIKSRKQNEGKEKLLHGLATYYLGIFVYWMSIVVITRIIACLQEGGWTSFGLKDNIKLIWTFLVFGTVWYGVFLIPLCFLSRYIIWNVYKQKSA